MLEWKRVFHVICACARFVAIYPARFRFGDDASPSELHAAELHSGQRVQSRNPQGFARMHSKTPHTGAKRSSYMGYFGSHTRHRLMLIGRTAHFNSRRDDSPRSEHAE